MENLPIYFKTVSFKDRYGREHQGYLEPPFSDEDEPLFVEEMLSESSQGYDALFFAIEDIISWQYINKSL